jgi:hypothetical protein
MTLIARTPVAVTTPAVRLAHAVAVALNDRQPIVTVARQLELAPFNMPYREAWLLVGSAIRQQSEKGSHA